MAWSLGMGVPGGPLQTFTGAPGVLSGDWVCLHGPPAAASPPPTRQQTNTLKLLKSREVKPGPNQDGLTRPMGIAVSAPGGTSYLDQGEWKAILTDLLPNVSRFIVRFPPPPHSLCHLQGIGIDKDGVNEVKVDILQGVCDGRENR